MEYENGKIISKRKRDDDWKGNGNVDDVDVRTD